MTTCLEKYVSGDYLGRFPEWHKGDSRWKAQRILETVPPSRWKPSAGGENLKILDVGCGAGGVLGSVLRLLQERGIRAQGLGIDPSADAIAIAERDWPAVAFQCTGPHALSGRFDMALLIDVVEHAENPWELIRAVRERAETLIFHIPLDDSFLAELFNLFPYKTETMGHIHFFTRQRARLLLESCGLAIVAESLTAAFRESSASGIDWKHRALAGPRKWLSWVSRPLCARVLGGYSWLAVARGKV